MEWILRDILRTGRLLFEEGLVSARAGNLSVAFRDRIFITRTGSNLGDLLPTDVLELPLQGGDPLEERASVELDLHRSIVLETGKRAVVHAHPPHAVALSLLREEIDPPDYEARAVLGEVPLLDPSKLPRPALIRKTAELLRERKVVLLRGHGVFSAGTDLQEAYSYVSTLEHSCRLTLLSYTKEGRK